jgi:ribonuclease VapC
VVLDTSALLAVLLGEPERDQIVTLLSEAEDPLISAATLVEASIVMEARVGPPGVDKLDALLSAAGVRCVAVDITQAHVARDAFARYGKGRSSAGLNFGGCFAYALARAMDRRLLFKGEDFGRTDVTPALA